MSNVTTSKPLTRGKFFELFDDTVHASLTRLLDKPTTLGIVCYECLDMASSNFGARSALIYGPEQTYKTLEECLAGHLGQVPSQFRYPVAHYVKLAE